MRLARFGAVDAVDPDELLQEQLPLADLAATCEATKSEDVNYSSIVKALEVADSIMAHRDSFP